MGHQGAKTKEISFTENAGDVTVKVYGVSVEIHPDGSILAYTNGEVKRISTIANDDTSAKPLFTTPTEARLDLNVLSQLKEPQPKIGDKMADRTIFAGVSPDTGTAMYTTAADEPLSCTFKQAADQAAVLNVSDAFGHHDWRVPSKAELNVLFNNRAAISNFTSGSYWSSSQDYGRNAWGQRFNDGIQTSNNKDYLSSVRCVR
jgi:hypothetical protein